MIKKIKSSTKYKTVNRKVKLFINDKFIDNAKYLPQGFDRVYHYHVRKSGGTSVNDAFWKKCNHSIDTVGREPLLLGNKKSMVRLNKELIEKGNYFYGSAHFPYWQLSLKPKTYSFTVLRDPYKRILSLYKYYKWIEINSAEHGLKFDPSFEHLKSQKHLFQANLVDFIEVLSPKYLYGNIYMFSENLNVDEALDNLKNVNRILFQHKLSQDFTKVSKDLDLGMKIEKKLRKFNNENFDVSDHDIEYAKKTLEKDYDFYNKAIRLHE